MKNILIIIIYHICALCYSQNNNLLKLEIIDSINSSPINKGNIFLINDTDSLLYSSFNNNKPIITCNDEFYRFKKIKINSNSFSPSFIEIKDSICIDNKITVVKMSTSTINIKEVIIKAPLITQDIEKITYNVSSDPDSKNLMLLEFLPKLPFISLSPNDNPLFKGSSNFVILLNGKTSSLFSSNNLRDALKSLDTSTIDKIEIITDPPLRYLNEGAIGVLNIITKKNQENGYRASINSNIGTFISGINSSINYSNNKLGVIFQFSNNYERTPIDNSSTLTKNDELEIQSFRHRKVENSSIFGNLLLSYEVNKTTLLNIDFGLDFNKNKKKSEEYNNLTYLENYLQSKYSFNSDALYNITGYSLNLNYQKSFKNNKEQLLTLSYSFRNNINDGNIIMTPLVLENFQFEDQIQDSHNKNDQNIFQIDYVLPISKFKLELGSKYISRLSKSKYINTLDSINFDDYQNTTSIINIYNSIYYKLNSFSFRAGLRYEYTYFKNYNHNNYLSYSNEYNNLLPSVKINYKTNNNLIFSLGFRQSIQRPGISLLNPVIIKNSPFFFNSGNPNLKPVLLNSLTTEFSRYKNSSISISLNYTFSKNTIQSTTNVQDSIILTSYSNIGKYNKIGLDVSFETPLIKDKLDLSIDGSLYYVHTYNKAFYNKGLEGFAYSYLTYRFQKYRLFANMGYYGPTINIQAKNNSYLYSSLGISKSIFKNNGNLSFRLINPFQKYRKIESYINSDDLFQGSIQNIPSKGFYLSFNFKFGKLKNEIKQNKRKIQIDDTANETGKINK